MKIEDIIFNPIGFGEPPYKFEEVINTNPLQNISGQYNINGRYYKKVYML